MMILMRRLQVKKSGLQAEEVALWADTITKAIVQAIWQLYMRQEVHKK